YLGIYHDAPHRALADAYVTAEIFLKLKEKLRNLPYETITHLLRLEGKLKSDLYALLEQYQQASAFTYPENSGVVSYRGIALKDIKNPREQHRNMTISFGDYLDWIYEADGMLQKQIQNYEKRDGQREMSELIFDAFRSH